MLSFWFSVFTNFTHHLSIFFTFSVLFQYLSTFSILFPTFSILLPVIVSPFPHFNRILLLFQYFCRLCNTFAISFHFFNTFSDFAILLQYLSTFSILLPAIDYLLSVRPAGGGGSLQGTIGGWGVVEGGGVEGVHFGVLNRLLVSISFAYYSHPCVQYQKQFRS